MPLMTPGNCWRGRNDCISLASVEAIPDDVTEEQLDALSFTPESFVCCGCIRTEDRQEPQDAYRVCFHNQHGDDMSDNDDQDLAHLAYVIAQAQAVIATRRVNSGSVSVIDSESGEMVPVETKQRA